MSVYDYTDALKKGKKEYRTASGNGQYPYLPVLDEILKHTEIEKEVNLGICEIPLDRVVGTSTAGRTEAFARNFMPILEYGSEFSAKWSNLCDAQVAEGIRDPIEVYEYMNRFYVIEGNKRVSVLKYFDAVKITANVTRKVPKRTNDIENKIYYEFMDFYEIANNNSVYVTKLGSFSKIVQLVNYKERPWTEDQQKEFSAVYAMFRKVYKERGGVKLAIKSGDAFLAFLTFYGYETICDMTPIQMRSKISKIWNEFMMLAEKKQIDVVMNPDEQQEKESLNRKIMDYFLPFREKKYKAVFLYDKEPEQSDWIYAHELGRLYAQDCFQNELETKAVVVPNVENYAGAILEDLVHEGADIIFTVTPRLQEASLKVAVEHPEVRILNCALNTPHRYIRTYYGRMFEAKFLTGMIAGAVAENDVIGYIAEYPIFGTIANINAFALGAKLVNPRAKIVLEWSTMKNFDYGQSFGQKDIHCLSGQDFITPDSSSREFGLYYRSDEGLVNMAMPVWHWGVFYERLIKNILNGSWDKENEQTTKAYNYWWGISAGVIDVICSNNVPKETKRLVELVKTSISKGNFHPFDGELIDQNGDVRLQNGKTMSPSQIMTMDWLLDNVEGVIPTVEDLNPESRSVVYISGVRGTEAEDSTKE